MYLLSYLYLLNHEFFYQIFQLILCFILFFRYMQLNSINNFYPFKILYIFSIIFIFSKYLN